MKKLTLPVVVALVIGAGLLTTGTTFAQSVNGSKTNLISELAQKLGVDQSKVQQAFDDIKKEHQTNIQNKMQSNLDALVKSGKITSAQEQAILAELATQKTKYDPSTLQGKTAAERKQFFSNEQTELKNWLSSQGLDYATIFPKAGMPGRMGRMH